MESQNLKSIPYKFGPVLAFIAGFFALFGFILLLNTTAFKNNYVYEELLMLGEKALLVFHGVPPRLENLGFVYPPLIYIFVLIFRNPLVASAFVGALCASTLLLNLYLACRIKRVPFLLFPVVLLFILASPSSLFLLCERQSLCLFLAVFLQLTYHLYRYCRYRYTLDLLLFGMMTAFMFFVRFQAVFLIPLLILPFLFPKNDVPAPEKLSITIIAFFPSCFFIGAWSYLNWIFMKDPLYFFRAWLNSVGSSSSHTLTEDFPGALFYCAEQIKILFPLILPFAVAIARQIKIGYRQCRVSPSILCAPVFMMIFDVLFGAGHEHSMSYSTLFLISALSSWMYMPLEKNTLWFDRLLIVSFMATFLFNWTFFSEYPEEKTFIKALERPIEHSTVSAAGSLLKNLDRESAVLIDDTRGFPVVFLEGNPRRFVLPYQYEYETVLSSPRLFVRYVVVSSPTTDRIAGKWPEALYGNLQGFKLVGRFGDFILYEQMTHHTVSSVP